MKFYVDADERYPEYFLSSVGDSYSRGTIEITAEEYADFERVGVEFDAWQKRIGELLRGAK